MKPSIRFKAIIFLFTVLSIGCGQSRDKNTNQIQPADSIPDTTGMNQRDTTHPDPGTKAGYNALPRVYVYNFHVTNRCVACRAIEEVTTRTLDSCFAAELKIGRVKRYIIDVDDEANRTIAEKYQVFGSGIFITRIFRNKETTTDLTGDGFRYARKKPEKFSEILKNKIDEYLK